MKDVAPGTAGQYSNRGAFLFGCLVLVLLSFAELLRLPGDASLGSAFLLIGIPYWFNAAVVCDRKLLDPFAQTSVRIILGAAGFLIFWSLLSVLDAENPYRVSRYIVSLAGAFAMYFLIVGTATHERGIRIVQLLAVVMALVSLISVAAYFNERLGVIIFEDSDRAKGFFKNPNQFGIVISTILPSAAVLALAQRRRRLLWIACLFAMLLGLVMSGSKTNILLSLTTLILLFTLASIMIFQGWALIAMILTSLLAGGLLIAGGIAALNLFNPRALELLTIFLGQEGSVPSLQSRSLLWQSSVQSFLQSPILGEGAGQKLLISISGETISQSHNVFLDYARTLGVPGLAGMLIIYGAVILVCISTIYGAFLRGADDYLRRLLSIGVSLSCLSYLLANMNSDSFGPLTSPFFWVLFFLACTLRTHRVFLDNDRPEGVQSDGEQVPPRLPLSGRVARLQP